jgi:phosphoserine phosphatase
MDKHTGKIEGINCTKEEKVRRLMDAHPGAVVEDFYSDSLKDTPMARIAEKAYMVKKDRITEWYLPQ